MQYLKLFHIQFNVIEIENIKNEDVAAVITELTV